jgi:hypothetical protein
MAKAKRAKKPQSIEVDGAPITSFKDVTEAFINTVGQVVLALKQRPGGAANYGTDGLFVAAVEALHTARASKNLEDFLKAAAYSVSAALKACGAWEYPLEVPKPKSVKKTKPSAKKGDN